MERTRLSSQGLRYGGMTVPWGHKTERNSAPRSVTRRKNDDEKLRDLLEK